MEDHEKIEHDLAALFAESDRKRKRDHREDGGITLGELIRLLEKKDAKLSVRFAFCNVACGELESYRGYYEDLSVQPAFPGSKPVYETVGDLLNALRGAIGKEYTGYKGGEFAMHDETLLWVAEYGHSGSTAITGLSKNGDLDYRVYIETKRIG